MILKPGMYVSCPMNTSGNIIFLMGQITSANNTEKITVSFYDLQNRGLIEMYGAKGVFDAELLERAYARTDAQVKYSDCYARLLPSFTHCDENGFRMYFIEYYNNANSSIALVPESDLRIHMTEAAISPAKLLQNKSISNPNYYKNRTIISEAQAKVSNAPAGFVSILGSRANLYPHQIDTVVRALSSSPCRLMLADEVGLGKTIEACAVIRSFISRNRNARVLVVVPNALRAQWIDELKSRFRIKTQVIIPSILPAALVKSGVFISDYDTFSKISLKMDLEKKPWDICVIDEAHKLLSNRTIYDKVKNLSRLTANILILSATPVMNNKSQYKDLLSLLEPKKYSGISDQNFMQLVKYQPKIRDIIDELQGDLTEYVEYRLSTTYAERFTEIQALIKDDNLSKWIDLIEAESDQTISLEYSRAAIAYVLENYKINRNIIRHRKKDIQDAHATRVLIDIPYEPIGSEKTFYENECLTAALELFKDVLSKNNSPETIDMCKKLLQATTSSPYAVYGIVINIPAPGYTLLDNYLYMLGKWRQAYDIEIKNIETLKNGNGEFNSRLAKIISWIEAYDSNKEKKYLVYSEYTHTANKYYEAFTKYFGVDSSRLFVSGLTENELRKITQEFQNTKECRFLICDSTGGVGRNFQMADYIIHSDISWSPAIMEQRIGRLDRIGRCSEKEVVSVVIHTDYGIENELFLMYRDGLRIFNKSICGMELAFDDIQTTIDNAFMSDPEHGIKNAIPKITDYVQRIDDEIEQEQYFNQSQQMDTHTEMVLERLVQDFELSNDSGLSSAMCRWAKKIGIKELQKKRVFYDRCDAVIIDLGNLDLAAQKGNAYVLPFKPDHEKIFGTFSRRSAVSHEGLYFMAPSNALFDSIARNAETSAKGMTAFLHITDAGFPWEGFSFCWNIKFDYSKVVMSGFPPAYLDELTKYMSSVQIRVFVSVPEFIVAENDLIANSFETYIASKATIACENANYMRTDSSKHLADYDWRISTETSYEIAKKYAASRCGSLVDLPELKDHLSNRKHIEEFNKACTASRKMSTDEYVDLFVSSMANPIIELDSAAYVIME